MKAVMLSIRPQWVEKIVNGEKTIEVRKSRPNIETPFKCYIYATAGKPYLYKNPNKGEVFLDRDLYRGGSYEERFLSGKVIGEFVCDGIEGGFWLEPWANYLQKQSCLTWEEINKYGKGEKLYGWHISDLKIYDKPKELMKFFVKGACYAKLCYKCDHYIPSGSYYEQGDCLNYSLKPLSRPPQSWCYVEEN